MNRPRWLNGHLAVDVIDNDRAKSAQQGLLAFQLHSGPRMKIGLKEIWLRELPAEHQAD